MRWSKRLACLLVVVFATCILAQDPITLTIEGGNAQVIERDKVTITKEKVTLLTTFPFQIKAPKGYLSYKWSYPRAIEALDLDDTLEITSAPKGDLTITVVLVSGTVVDGKVIPNNKVGRASFAVGEIGPQPKPDPKPDPKPPEPKPDVAPFPSDGPRVCFILDSSSDDAPAAAYLRNSDIRSYLNSHTVKEASGGVAGWRWYVLGTPPDNDWPVWREAYKAKPADAKAPYMLIVDGKGNGWKGPVPETQDKLMEVLKKYLGP